MAGSAAKDRIIYPLEKRVVNPIVMLAWDLGLPPPGDALLETTGRRTGQPRRTPVCDGLDGETFWLVAQRGHRADWVQNIAANPRVRVKFRSGSGIGRRLAGRDSAHPRRGRPARAAAAPGSGQPHAPVVRARIGGNGHQPADGTHRPGSPLILTRAAAAMGGRRGPVRHQQKSPGTF